MSQHVALLFNLGVLKKLFAGFGGWGQLPPCPPASYGPRIIVHAVSRSMFIFRLVHVLESEFASGIKDVTFVLIYI